MPQTVSEPIPPRREEQIVARARQKVDRATAMNFSGSVDARLKGYVERYDEHQAKNFTRVGFVDLFIGSDWEAYAEEQRQIVGLMFGAMAGLTDAEVAHAMQFKLSMTAAITKKRDALTLTERVNEACKLRRNGRS